MNRRAADILDNLKNPPEEFTPFPFWFFNDEPDKDRIREQLTDYAAKGVNGFVLHPRIGVPETLPYLSREYFEAVRFIVETAASLDMKVVLYDEGMYPSGSAHGMVAAADPEYASKGIRLCGSGRTDPETADPNDAFLQKKAEEIVRLQDGRSIVYGFTGGTIRGIHFGEDDGEAGAPASADILNPDAVDLFIRLTHDQYYEHLKEYFGNTIIAFFTDEPCALGRNAGQYREWVPGMEAEILAEGGRLEDLRLLFSSGESVSEAEERTLAVYHRLIKKHLRETFYGKLSKWCESHGIALTGHPAVSDDVEEQLYFQIPGQDLIMRRVVPKTGGLREFDSVQAKLSADIAGHLGRRRNANECFGVCYRGQLSWYFTAEDMKWYIDWLGVRGVNLFIPHAFYYSVEGKRSEERPPDVGPNNIWWKHYRRFSDYIKRLSWLMTDSVNGSRIAVLCDNNRVPYLEIAPLYENQIEFNYLPVGLLTQCRIEENRLAIGAYRYEAVLDPFGLLKSGQEKTLSEWLREHQVSVSAVWKAEERRSVLTEESCPGLRAVHLKKDEQNMLLLSNEGCEPIRTRLRIPGWQSECLMRVDLWRGEWEPIFADEEFVISPCETLLLLEGLTDCARYAEEERMRYIPGQKRFLGNWTEKFRCAERTQNQAVYEMIYEAEQITGTEYFTVYGEEMAECFCNGELADVSFWNEHTLRIGGKLRQGENRIRLVLTGSAANIYNHANIPFGLKGRKGWI